METKSLAFADIQTGINLSIQAQRHMAALEALQVAEAELIDNVRKRMGLGSEWALQDWLQGFVRDEGSAIDGD